MSVNINHLLPGFRGNIEWVHAREDWPNGPAHPYWPKGKSGITLRPGIDLGYINPRLAMQAVGHLLTPRQMQAMKVVLDNQKRLRGEAAKNYLERSPALLSIRISYQQGHQLMPVVAAPYWRAIVGRFPTLSNGRTPGAVQTAMLSLAFNRGAYNRELGVLAEPIRFQQWEKVGHLIAQMQQNHQLAGIRKRRRMEGQLVLNAA